MSTDFDVDKDDVMLLNEILNTPATTAGTEFSSEWHAAFGTAGPPLMAAGTPTASDADSKMADFFMPSSLLDMTAGNLSLSCTFVILCSMFCLAKLFPVLLAVIQGQCQEFMSGGPKIQNPHHLTVAGSA